MGGAICPDANTEALQKKIESLNNMCFPFKSRKIRSNHDNIRRKIRRRKRAYTNRKSGRDKRWNELKKDTNEAIWTNKKKYYEKEAARLMTPGSNSIPFKSLHHIYDADAPQKWTVNQLAPELTDLELAEDLAKYFVRITDEFEPLVMNNLPVTYSVALPVLLPHEVAQRIRSAKKPQSAVDGDVLPCMINQYSDLIAIPATRIFNIALQMKKWPQLWKIETQTPIPKKGIPGSYSNLRNISCTNYLSKILESFVLERLQSEVKFKYSQFGGIKKTGTTHFLADTIHKIIDCLEDGRSAVSILLVDFSKAFNRMCHRVCIGELALRGASTESIEMVAVFLGERRMQMKVNQTRSSLKPVRGGSPQGTRLANFLFTVTIEAIEEKNRLTHGRHP